MGCKRIGKRLCDGAYAEQYRFVFCAAIGFSQMPFYGDSVSSREIAAGQLNNIVNYTLHLHKEKLMQDYSNIGYIETLINDDWEELEGT